MGNISVDYDVLNQKGSPAWYSDLFANIPTPGYKGRMFISTDTFAFYRDNGVGWDLVGGPGTGTITGAGVSGQLTYFIGTDVISGNNNLFYDITNGRLGINTATPGAPLDIHSTGTAAQFNGTGVNNAFVLFQNAGTSKWRIGNLYNSGANDYQIYDVLNATARLTIKNTGATTLTGTFTATSLIKSGGTNLQILLADGTTTPTSTFGAGSVTSVSALTLGTTGTDLTSSVANSTTTPVITLNVPTASATNRGALSSTDWTTFNNKQATITLTTTGTSGAATLVGATLNIPNYTNVGTVTSVAALTLGTTGTDLSSSVANSTSTPVITLNVPTASATNRGALSSADWTTFNSKQATISVTAPVVLTGATISMPAATTSVNGYLTSTDWNTFNNKSNTNGTVTSVVALTIGTTGIDITSTAVTTTTTPVITLNIPTASASNRGALSSTDWTTFNNKQATLSLTTTGTSGAATLVANTLNVPNYGSALSGYVPYTGATANLDLGTFTLTAKSATFNATTSGPTVTNYYSGLSGIQDVSYGIGKSQTSGNSGFFIWKNNNGNGYLAVETYGSASPIYYNGSSHIFSVDATINSLTIGKGNNSLNENTAIGVNALKLITTGNFNTGVGVSALYSNTTGTLNTGVGNEALVNNTTGGYNTGIGASALVYNTTGGNNTGIGSVALGVNTTGSNNTAIGQAALNQNSTGQQNTAVGSVALTSVTGSNNIGVGYSAGSSITTGTYNTIVGSATNITTGSYNTIIGIANTLGNVSNNIALADGQGNIKYNWDGTNNNFYGSGSFSGILAANRALETNVALSVSGVGSTSASYTSIYRNSAGADMFVLRNDGFTLLSIFTYNNTTTNIGNLFIDSSGGLYRSTASSLRFKDNILDWNGKGLDIILALKPRTFNYKKEYYKNTQIEMLGLIAEEVAEVCPYLAEYENEDRTGQIENVKYANIVVPLIKAIQELNEKLIRNNIN